LDSTTAQALPHESDHGRRRQSRRWRPGRTRSFSPTCTSAMPSACTTALFANGATTRQRRGRNGAAPCGQRRPPHPGGDVARIDARQPQPRAAAGCLLAQPGPNLRQAPLTAARSTRERAADATIDTPGLSNLDSVGVGGAQRAARPGVAEARRGLAVSAGSDEQRNRSAATRAVAVRLPPNRPEREPRSERSHHSGRLLCRRTDSHAQAAEIEVGYSSSRRRSSVPVRGECRVTQTLLRARSSSSTSVAREPRVCSQTRARSPC
jgi:hypothetical protein